MILYKNALKKVESEFKKTKIKTEKVELLNSINRILAEDVYADADQPNFTNSAMDGFAVKYAKGNNEWKIIGEISAGGFKIFQVKQGEAVLIMTGSRIPHGTDTVIPIEDTKLENNNAKLLNNISLYKGANIRYKGEDLVKGKLLIKKNSVLRSNNITMAASCGKSSLKVFKRLKIGVLATGNELIDINIIPKGDKIRASNLYSLLSAISEINMEPVSFGIVKDNKEEIKKRIKNALDSDIDILLTAGGVSVGKYDLLINIFRESGIKIVFSKAKIKPGKPIVFGVYNMKGKRVLVFGLPGNPVSCYVDFILFVRNVIMNCLVKNNKLSTSAVLKDTLKKYDNKRHFVRGLINNRNGIDYVSPSGIQSSANIGGLNLADALIVFEENKTILKQRSKVECIRI